MKKNVLDIGIDDISIDQAVEIVGQWLSEKGLVSEGGKKHYIVTTNPEIVMMAQQDKDLKFIIDKADLSIPDGVGLRLSGEIVCYSPGIDVMEELIRHSLDYGFTIGLLGGGKGVAEKCAECLRKKYPKVKITFINDGGVVNRDGEALNSEYRIPDTDLLFVAFGQPKQEKWISKNLAKIPVKVVMGVGGSFDFLSGNVPRAPKWVRGLGLEWLFRLIIQPWRIRRQLTLIKYLWLLMSSPRRRGSIK